MNPHLSRRERVHPGNHTNTFIIVVGSLKRSRYFLSRINGSFINHLDWQISAGIQAGNHFITMCIYGNYSIATIQ